METLSQNRKQRRAWVETGRQGREEKAGIFLSSFVFKTLFAVGHRSGPLRVQGKANVSGGGKAREKSFKVRNRQVQGEQVTHPTFYTCWEAGSFSEK